MVQPTPDTLTEMATHPPRPPTAFHLANYSVSVRVGLVSIITYICLFHGMTAFGLVGPDEPRYAAIARDMATGDDWVTPRLHGQPWLEKPILYYWGAAVGYRLFDDSELAARLPSALSALAALLALAWLTRRFYGNLSALLFGLLFPSSIAILVFARAATPDMLFSSTLALTLTAAMPLVLVSDLRRVFAFQVAFGTALGLAVLAKGPAGVVLAGSSCLLGAVMAKRVSFVSRLAGLPALTSFALIALPWFVLCSLENPEFVQVFLVSHNLDRYLTPVFRHSQPFWFFVPVILLALAPWTAGLVAAVQHVFPQRKGSEWAGSPSVFLAAWALFPVAFFSLSQSKLPGYVLPAVPATTILLAHALALTVRDTKRARAHGIGLAAVMGAMTLTFLVAPGVESSGVEPGAVRPLSVVLGIASVLTGYLGHQGRLGDAIATTALGVALALGQLNVTVLPTLDPVISPRAAAKAASVLADGRPIRSHGLHRAWQYGLEYYLRGPVAAWPHGDSTDMLVVTTTRGMREMQLAGVSVVLLQSVSDEALLVQTDSEATWPTYR